MTYIYTGPSWAFSSYDPPGIAHTSLAKEWGLDYVNLSKPGSSILDRIKAIRSCNKSTLPIIFVYNEPLLDLTTITGLTLDNLIQRSDWTDVRNECNRYCLNEINNLKRPVLLIGAHSDITDCNYPNITIGHPSWQKFIAAEAGLTIKDGNINVMMDDGGNYSFNLCWGAEIVHKFIHEFPNLRPSTEIVNAVWDIFFFWQCLEKSNLFFEVHPNRRATKLYAKFLLPIVTKFLEENKS